ncbi:unnamed protein product [Phytomonas sp. Hart1]|nr:unnamed protein product [Phytomonas sp. Hart1]|eukprot:CCW67288.1 unnamed protein product [Phytomonas sp. isolate Hart1]
MKFERLALPIGHNRKPFAVAQPNYGRLINFEEEERRERETREHNMHTPFVYPKERSNHTIPSRNPQVTRLAQSKHTREPLQLSQSQLKASTQNVGRPTSADYTRSASVKTDRLHSVDTSSKTRSHSTGKFPSTSQAKSSLDPTPRSTFSKRHQRQTATLNQFAAFHKGYKPQHTYGGTTIISYTPSALSEARERCAAMGVSKVDWKSLKPPRRAESIQLSLLRPEEGTVVQPALACPPATRAVANAFAEEKVQVIVSQAAPSKSIDTMPRPPMKVRTHRFVNDEDNTKSEPWGKDPSPTPQVVIYATARSV